jgi:hypothetical protein
MIRRLKVLAMSGTPVPNPRRKPVRVIGEGGRLGIRILRKLPCRKVSDAERRPTIRNTPRDSDGCLRRPGRGRRTTRRTLRRRPGFGVDGDFCRGGLVSGQPTHPVHQQPVRRPGLGDPGRPRDHAGPFQASLQRDRAVPRRDHSALETTSGVFFVLFALGALLQAVNHPRLPAEPCLGPGLPCGLGPFCTVCEHSSRGAGIARLRAVTGYAWP